MNMTIYDVYLHLVAPQETFSSSVLLVHHASKVKISCSSSKVVSVYVVHPLPFPEKKISCFKKKKSTHVSLWMVMEHLSQSNRRASHPDNWAKDSEKMATNISRKVFSVTSARSPFTLLVILLWYWFISAWLPESQIVSGPFLDPSPWHPLSVDSNFRSFIYFRNTQNLVCLEKEKWGLR